MRSGARRIIRLLAMIGLITTSLALSLPGRADAAPLEKPLDAPVLVVTGAIDVTNQNGTAQFDRAMLEKLGMVSFETTTPWYKERTRFEGVPLSALIAAVGGKGSHLLVTALNDYSSEIPMQDVRSLPVILALKRNGDYMSVRDKGPLFIVYDFDRQPGLKNPAYYTRCVWQIKSIEIR